MARLKLTAVICLALCACRGEAPQESAPTAIPGYLAFTNAVVWDGTGYDSVNATMVVRDGRIESIGAEPVPATATVIDLDGAYVMPGLINAHGHVSGRWAEDGITDPKERVLADLRLFARYGVTTVNSLGGAPVEAIAVRDAQDDHELDRARLYVAGAVIADTDPNAARASAEANAKMGVDWLKLRVDDNLGRTEKMPWEAVEAVFEAASAAGLPVATHVFYLEDALELIELKTSMIAHSVRDQAVTNEFIEKLRESGACYVPTLTREVSTFVYAERPRFFDDPFFLEYADRDEVARVSDPEFMREMTESEVAAGYRKAWVQAMENLKELSDAGVAIAFGTDSGPPARFPGYFEHMELEMMVMAGLTAQEALLSATLDAADCLGLDDVGTLEPGKWADFLVLDEDPLADIAATKSLRSVYIAGNEVARR